MHSLIAVESKYNCDSPANYWQLSLSLHLPLPALRHKSPRPLPRAAFNYAGRPNAVEGFICAPFSDLPPSLALEAIRDLPRNVAVTRAALAAFQLRRSSNLLIDK